MLCYAFVAVVARLHSHPQRSNLVILTSFLCNAERGRKSGTKCGSQFYETPKVIAARERLYERGCKTHGAEEQTLLERFKEWGREKGGGGGGPWTDLPVTG